jgi:hypothetical protein
VLVPAAGVTLDEQARLALEVEELRPPRGARERQLEGGGPGHELGHPYLDLPQPLGLDERKQNRDVRRVPAGASSV